MMLSLLIKYVALVLVSIKIITAVHFILKMNLSENKIQIVQLIAIISIVTIFILPLLMNIIDLRSFVALFIFLLILIPAALLLLKEVKQRNSFVNPDKTCNE